jgi:hypothetical protein
VDATGCGEDTHELLVGLERLAKIELDIHVFYVLKIGGERGEMIGVKPGPGWRLCERKGIRVRKIFSGWTYSLIVVL